MEEHMTFRKIRYIALATALVGSLSGATSAQNAPTASQGKLGQTTPNSGASMSNGFGYMTTGGYMAGSARDCPFGYVHTIAPDGTVGPCQIIR
jgi:hypothetical protein